MDQVTPGRCLCGNWILESEARRFEIDLTLQWGDHASGSLHAPAPQLLFGKRLLQPSKSWKGYPFKGLELRLVAELMKNCHRGDKEFAQALGTSQSTVARTRIKLEKECVVREYAMIPDFAKLGFGVIVVNLLKLKRGLTPGGTSQS